mgnify:CR=1 FL=1
MIKNNLNITKRYVILLYFADYQRKDTDFIQKSRHKTVKFKANDKKSVIRNLANANF